MVTVMSRLAGSVLVEIQEAPSLLLISALRFVEMESTEAGIPVMMGIYRMATDVQQIVFRSLGIDALEETLKQ